MVSSRSLGPERHEATASPLLYRHSPDRCCPKWICRVASGMKMAPPSADLVPDLVYHEVVVARSPTFVFPGTAGVPLATFSSSPRRFGGSTLRRQKPAGRQRSQENR